jgi:uncharacterized protein
MVRPFHLAIPVTDLESARKFYGDVFGCNQGRSSDLWIDWDFFGHQLVTHVSPKEVHIVPSNIVDKHKSPCRHFGIVLEWDEWHNLVKKLEAHQLEYISKPHTRFKGLAGEQATLMICDLSLNAIEFKAFKDDSHLFAKQ